MKEPESVRQFLCPISMQIMQDPVIVTGSGNTYDRKSIERHFQHFYRDPLNNTELRRPADRNPPELKGKSEHVCRFCADCCYYCSS